MPFFSADIRQNTRKERSGTAPLHCGPAPNEEYVTLNVSLSGASSARQWAQLIFDSFQGFFPLKFYTYTFPSLFLGDYHPTAINLSLHLQHPIRNPIHAKSTYSPHKADNEKFSIFVEFQKLHSVKRIRNDWKQGISKYIRTIAFYIAFFLTSEPEYRCVFSLCREVTF